MRKKGICHTSIRNELVCLLHGVYEDIHLIEDAQATIEYFYSEKIATRLYPALHTTPADSVYAKELTTALYEWMRNKQASKILSLLDPGQEIKKELFAYFKKHGSNPEQITVLDEGRPIPLSLAIENTCSRLVYPRNYTDQRTWAVVDSLLNESTDLPGQEKRNQALLKIQTWIMNHFRMGSPTSAVSGAFLLCQGHMQIIQNQSIINVSGLADINEINHLKKSCEAYFTEVIESTEGIIPKPSGDLLIRLNKVEQTISILKKKTHAELISNFFSFGLLLISIILML